MTDETMTELDLQILSHFRRDKLCEKCGGPLEADREVTCWKCDIKVHARTQLDWIETGTMNLAYQLGVRKPPAPARPAPQNRAKSDKTTQGTKKKTRWRETTVKKKAAPKKTTKRTTRKKK